jgi:hypothetical protein
MIPIGNWYGSIYMDDLLLNTKDSHGQRDSCVIMYTLVKFFPLAEAKKDNFWEFLTLKSVHLMIALFLLKVSLFRETWGHLWTEREEQMVHLAMRSRSQSPFKVVWCCCKEPDILNEAKWPSWGSPQFTHIPASQVSNLFFFFLKAHPYPPASSRYSCIFSLHPAQLQVNFPPVSA